MEGAVFVLSRKVGGDNGEEFMQNVTVFAADATAARALVSREFARIRRYSSSPERPYADTPAWNVEKFSLDEEKLITADITS